MTDPAIAQELADICSIDIAIAGACKLTNSVSWRGFLLFEHLQIGWKVWQTISPVPTSWVGRIVHCCSWTLFVEPQKLSLKQWVHPYHYNSGWDFDWIPFNKTGNLDEGWFQSCSAWSSIFFFWGGLWGEEIGTGGVMGRFNQIPNHSTLEATVAILFLQVLLFWVAWTLVVSQAGAFQPSLMQEVVSLEGQPCFTAT